MGSEGGGGGGGSEGSWSVILQKTDTQQVVLYNEDEKRVIIKEAPQSPPPKTDEMTRGGPATAVCSLCKRPFDKSLPSTPFMDDAYFRHLETMFRWERQSRPEPILLPASATSSAKLPSGIFNQGYYRRFFREGRRLGRGAKGHVYLAQHMLDNEILGEYAVKKIAVGDNVEWLQRMLKEVHIMEPLRHPNIVAYKHSWLEVCQLSQFAPAVPCLFILMEYADGGNLEGFIITKLDESSKIATTLADIISIFLGICKGLEHLHRFGIIHRDLKPQNILLSSSVNNIQALISDFGECNTNNDDRCCDERTGATGTIEFSAPELLRTDESGRYTADHSTMTDAWSLGMILYYLLSAGKLPYDNIDDIDVLREDMLRMKSVRPPSKLIKSIPPELSEILRGLLKIDPSSRMTVSSVIAKVESLLFRMKSTGDKLTFLPRQLPPGPSSLGLLQRMMQSVNQVLSTFMPTILVPYLLGASFCYPRSLTWTFYLLWAILLLAWRKTSPAVSLSIVVLWLAFVLSINKTICAY